MADEVRALNARSEQAGDKPRRLGVTWENLTITGIDSDATFNENVISQLYPFSKGGKSAPIKIIIDNSFDNSFGSVRPGEMLLVLGRLGTGCTTLLNVLSNNRLGYKEITGDVKFGTMTPKEAACYRGQIIMNTEEEVFYPMLTVENTIQFAARNKVPRHLPPKIPAIVVMEPKVFKLSKTKFVPLCFSFLIRPLRKFTNNIVRSRLEIVIELHDLALLSESTDPTSYTIHRLIQGEYRNYIGLEGQLETWRDAVTVLRELFPKQHKGFTLFNHWPLCESLIDNVEGLAERYRELSSQAEIAYNEDFAYLISDAAR